MFSMTNVYKTLSCRYHCLYNEIKDEHNPKEEYEFEEQAKIFISSYKAMQKKYQMLLIKQSQVSHSINVRSIQD